MYRLLLIPLACALVVGCSSSASGRDGPVFYSADSGDGQDAIIFGFLVFEQGCLLLNNDEDGVAYPVVWPPGTRWELDSESVRLANGALVEDGDLVVGTGGFKRLGTLGSEARFSGNAEIEECVQLAGDEIAVFNSRDTIEVEGR